jgi:predicted DNA-binding transcriptional regulator AlpA
MTILSIREVSDRLGITVSALRKRVERDRFPAPDMRFGWSLAWDEKTVEDYMRSNHDDRPDKS